MTREQILRRVQSMTQRRGPHAQLFAVSWISCAIECEALRSGETRDSPSVLARVAAELPALEREVDLSANDLRRIIASVFGRG